MVKVGCVILSCNQQENLEFTLAKLTSFDEIVIVNNQSEEDYTETIEKLKLEYKFKYIHIAEQTDADLRAHARNVGVAKLNTDVIVLLDGDIIPEGDIANHIREVYSAPDSGNVVLGGKRTDVNNAAQCSRSTPTLESNLIDATWFNTITYCFVCTKSNWDAQNGMDTNIVGWGFEDTDLTYRMYASGSVFYTAAFLRMHHVRHEQAFTSGRIHMPVNNCLYFIAKHNFNRDVMSYCKKMVTFFEEVEDYINILRDMPLYANYTLRVTRKEKDMILHDLFKNPPADMEYMDSCILFHVIHKLTSNKLPVVTVIEMLFLKKLHLV